MKLNIYFTLHENNCTKMHNLWHAPCIFNYKPRSPDSVATEPDTSARPCVGADVVHFCVWRPGKGRRDRAEKCSAFSVQFTRSPETVRCPLNKHPKDTFFLSLLFFCALAPGMTVIRLRIPGVPEGRQRICGAVQSPVWGRGWQNETSDNSLVKHPKESLSLFGLYSVYIT